MFHRDFDQTLQELLAQGKVDDAFKLLQSAINTNPTLVKIWLGLQDVYEKEGEHELYRERRYKKIKSSHSFFIV